MKEPKKCLVEEDDKENLPPKKKLRSAIQNAGTPAYQSSKRRQYRREASAKAEATSTDVIDEESIDISKPCEEPVLVTVETEQLTKSDLNILEDRTKWLNCKLINAGQFLLKKKFPATLGLHDVTLSRTLSFPSEDRLSVQILNCNQTHWVFLQLDASQTLLMYMTVCSLGMCQLQLKSQSPHLCAARRRLYILSTLMFSNKKWIQLWPLCSSICIHSI